MAAHRGDDEEAAALELKKKRTFRKFTYRGIDLDNLLDLTPEQLVRLLSSAAAVLAAPPLSSADHS